MKVIINFARPTYHPFPLFAWGIMIFQGQFPWVSKSFSHCTLQYKLDGVDMVTHINGEGVHNETISDFLARYTICEQYTVEVNSNEEEIKNWISQRKDKVYDNWQIVGFVVNFLGLTKTNVFGSDLRKYVCSEYVADFMSRFKGWRLGDSDNWDLMRVRRMLI